MNKIYIVIDNYSPDRGSIIYGIFSTKELAKKCVLRLEDADNNEYGENLNEDNTIEIDEYDIDFASK